MAANRIFHGTHPVMWVQYALEWMYVLLVGYARPKSFYQSFYQMRAMNSPYFPYIPVCWLSSRTNLKCVVNVQTRSVITTATATTTARDGTNHTNGCRLPAFQHLKRLPYKILYWEYSTACYVLYCRLIVRESQGHNAQRHQHFENVYLKCIGIWDNFSLF